MTDTYTQALQRAVVMLQDQADKAWSRRQDPEYLFHGFERRVRHAAAMLLTNDARDYGVAAINDAWSECPELHVQLVHHAKT